ncbi:NAD(P)-dependent oxidoreductase [Lactobacillus sp. Sy-1]|uniref:NAD(P)-dependent oxidoreductase n=1 Tax=Lactobacillus sp. Sy-1 TaxID=2109645 RepID=UPI001C5BDD47|nr:NAD(P)-dependent oxidoreductase [Lactobacillus sp. Sy-1]MBW1606377.1 3-phosphoglycerate dehydrogenase [Lactobacillus sp. Sy-1]
MVKKVLLTPGINRFINERMKEHGIEPVVIASQKPEDILKLANDVDAIILMSGAFPNAMFDHLHNLKIIARQGIGYNNIDLDVAANHGVWVSNVPGGNARAVAEGVINDMLTLAKDSYNVSKEMREGNSAYGRGELVTEISHKTLGIIGYGSIGQLVAKMAAAFDMDILIYNRTPRDSPYGSMATKEEIFQKADYVSLHLPATKQTINTVAMEQLKMMKKSAYLLNLSRGALVNQDDLVTALQDHEIAGAALDVYETEPLPMNSPLRNFKNVFITPHYAGHTEEAWDYMANRALDNILNVLDGKDPVTPVNKIR